MEARTNILILTLIFIFLACSNSKQQGESKPTVIDINETKRKKPESCSYKPLNNQIDTLDLYKNSKTIEIRSYEMPYINCCDDEFEEDGSNPNKKDPIDNYVERIIINNEQKDSLFHLLTGFKKDFHAIGSDCFWPRHRIAFIDNNKKTIGTIDICFECRVINSNINLFKYLCEEQLHYYKEFLKWCGIQKGFNNNYP